MSAIRSTYQNFLNSFLQKVVDPYLRRLEEIRSSENEVRDKITPEQWNQIAQGELLIVPHFSKKVFRRMNSKQKLLVWILLDYARHYREKEFRRVRYLTTDLELCLHEDLRRSEKLSHLLKFDWVLRELWYQEKVLNDETFVRMLFSEWLGHNTNNLGSKNLLEFSLEWLFTRSCHLQKPPRARKTQFRKGYRDHGSLGSEFSRTCKEQGRSPEFLQKERERIEREERIQNDVNDFLAGWLM